MDEKLEIKELDPKQTDLCSERASFQEHITSQISAQQTEIV